MNPTRRGGSKHGHLSGHVAVEYPDRPLDRLTTFFRVFTVIPIAIVMATITGFSTSYHDVGDTSVKITTAGIGLLFLPPLLLILFREKYPRWWFDWNLNFQRFSDRMASTYCSWTTGILRPTRNRACTCTTRIPRSRTTCRGMPLVKWFLAIPHYVVLFFLTIGAFFAVVFAWFAILFTGRYPRGLFDYVEGVLRWHNRVVGYAFALVTDQYPPFRLEA